MICIRQIFDEFDKLNNIFVINIAAADRSDR